MEWAIFAVSAAVLYGVFDLFVKLASGKLDDGLSGLIINAFAALTLLVFVAIDRIGKQGAPLVTKDGVIYSIIAGVIVGLTTIAFIKMFASGTNLSIGVSIVRVGAVVTGVLLGVFLLKEELSARQMVGAVVALVGLAVILLPK